MQSTRMNPQEKTHRNGNWRRCQNFEHGLDHIFCTELIEGATDVQLSEIMDALFRMTSAIGSSIILHFIPGAVIIPDC